LARDDYPISRAGLFREGNLDSLTREISNGRAWSADAKAVPELVFGLPGKRKYPMRDAKARGSASQKEQALEGRGAQDGRP
jgi:hypothetical protein